MRRSELPRRHGTTCHEPLISSASIGRRIAGRALVTLLTAAGTLSGSVMAQDVGATDLPSEGAAAPSDTLVARFDLPPGALDDVANSAQLIALLREHLSIALAMPMDEPLVVNLHGSAGRRAGGAGAVYAFGLSPLGVGYDGESPLQNFSYALAVRESHGADFPPDDDGWAEFDTHDWDEEEAWTGLVEALNVGLPQSTAEFGQFGEGGHVDLAVSDVHLREFTLDGPTDSAWVDFGGCCDDLNDRAVLVLRPQPVIHSTMTEGDDSADEVPLRLNVLVIELDPIPAGRRADPVSESPASAQEAASPNGGSVRAASDAEALAMTRSLQGVCHAPQLAGSDVPSTAKVTFDDEPRTGDAIVAVDGEIDRVFRLGGGEGDARFCLILMGRSGPSGPGTYPIRKLARDRMESEPDPADPWIAASLGFGSDSETLFVAESGFVEITSMEPSVRGHFELIGWTGDGVSRSEEKTIAGSFEAAPGARQR